MSSSFLVYGIFRCSNYSLPKDSFFFCFDGKAVWMRNTVLLRMMERIISINSPSPFRYDQTVTDWQ